MSNENVQNTNVEETSTQQTKTYSEEEYKEMQSQLEKMKNAFDKTSSELSSLKKAKKEEEQAKMSADEKANARIKELEEALSTQQKEFNKSNMTSSLLESGYSREDASKIAESFIGNDMQSLLDTLTTSRKTLVENHSKELESAKLLNIQQPTMSSGAISPLDSIQKSFQEAQSNNNMQDMVSAIMKANQETKR